MSQLILIGDSTQKLKLNNRLRRIKIRDMFFYAQTQTPQYKRRTLVLNNEADSMKNKVVLLFPSQSQQNRNFQSFFINKGFSDMLSTGKCFFCTSPFGQMGKHYGHDCRAISQRAAHVKTPSSA